MIKIKHIDPDTFVETDVEFLEQQIEIIEILAKSVENSFHITPRIVQDTEGKAIAFGIRQLREPGGPIGQKYKVTVEKV